MDKASVYKDLLKTIVNTFDSLPVYEVETNDPGCDCCGVSSELVKVKTLKDTVYFDEVLKAEDVKEILTPIKELLETLK